MSLFVDRCACPGDMHCYCLVVDGYACLFDTRAHCVASKQKIGGIPNTLGGRQGGGSGGPPGGPGEPGGSRGPGGPPSELSD